MNVVLGFGSTEQDFENAEESAIREHIARRYNELGLDYFTDSFVTEIRDWLSARAKASQAKADEYKTAGDYPSRYSYYWSSVVADASNIVPILAIHNINRRHAMSPDGWALLMTERIFRVVSYEIESPSDAQPTSAILEKGRK